MLKKDPESQAILVKSEQQLQQLDFANMSRMHDYVIRISCDCDLVVLTESGLECSNNFYIPRLQNYTMLRTTKHLNQSGIL